jgi:hypothetical protein
MDGGRLSPAIPRCRVAPATDPAFASAAVALVLTGMGHDGADARAWCGRGGIRDVQDAQTSIVYSMPQATRRGRADAIARCMTSAPPPPMGCSSGCACSGDRYPARRAGQAARIATCCDA